MPDFVRETLVANVADRQGAVDRLRAAKRPTAKQKRDLAIDLGGLARAQAALDLYDATHEAPPPVPQPVIVDVGPAPYPSHGRHSSTQFYDCPDAALAEFESRHGYPIQTAFDRLVTGYLRPAGRTADDATRQAAALAFLDGSAPFEFSLDNYIGPDLRRFLGCIDISAIHDLGA